MVKSSIHLIMNHKQGTIIEAIVAIIIIITNLVVKQEKIKIQVKLRLLMGQHSMEI